MTSSQQLREQMWDFVYGLLEADESQALIARIKSDPAAARLYAEVRLQADLVGYAARIDDPSVVLSTEAAEKPAPAPREKSAAAASKQRPPGKRAASRTRAGAWLALGAATALAALLAVGQFWPAPSQQQLAASYIVTDVEAPPTMPGGLGNSLAFHTTTLDGEPQPATVDFAIRGREGRELFRQQVQTDQEGRAWADIPGSALEPGVRLEVFDVAAADARITQKQSAQKQFAQKQEEQELALENAGPVGFKVSKFASLAADLPVQAEPQMAYVLLEEPLTEGDKPVNASVWNFYAFSGKPAPPETAEQVAQNIPGLALADERGAATQQGVFKGVLQNQAQSPAALGFAEQNNRGGFSGSGRYGYGVAPPAEPAATIAPQEQQQEQQQAQGQQVQQQQAQQLQKQLAIVPDSQRALTQAEGAAPEAARSPAPDRPLQRAAEQLDQKQLGQQQPGQQVEQKLSESAQATDGYARFRSDRGGAKAEGAARALQDRSSALASGNEGFGNAATNVAPGEPINVDIPPEYAGKPLVVAANARGVMVANTSVPAGGQASDGKQQRTAQRSAGSRNKLGQLAENVELTLPPEADGPIEVAVLDPASSPPQVVTRNFVYREPTRKLQIDVHELKERFLPGERVQVTLAVRDEAGRPAADTRLGVRLWNEDLVQQNAEQPLLLAEALQAGLPGAAISQYSRNAASAVTEAATLPAGPPADAPANSDELGRETRANLEAKRGAATEPAKELERLADAKDKAAVPASDSAAVGQPGEQPKSNFGRAESQTTASPTPEAAPPPASADGQPAVTLPAAEDFEATATDWFTSLSATTGLEPVELATNRPAVQAAYDAVADAARDEHHQILRALGGVAVFGGLTLFVLIAVLVARRAAGSVGVMVPTLVVAVASLLIGCFWIGWLPTDGRVAHVAMTGELPPAAATPALVARAEFSADSQPAPTSMPSSGFADAPAPPTIPLANPMDPQGAVDSVAGVQREPAVAGGAALDVARGELPIANDGRARLSGEQLDRKLVPLAGTKPGPGSQPVDAAKAVADADREKAFGGIDGVPAQPVPTLASPVPAASATAGQTGASPTEGATLLGAKNEGEPSTRARRLAAGGAGGAAGSPAAPLPASLYFNPNLQTNDQGLATIEFTLPPANSQYRLLIDALGNGRIGSRQDLITIQGEGAK